MHNHSMIRFVPKLNKGFNTVRVTLKIYVNYRYLRNKLETMIFNKKTILSQNYM